MKTLLAAFSAVDMPPLSAFMRFVREHGFNVVIDSTWRFPNGALTWAAVLMQSHCVIHTYPELGVLYLDLFCCDERFEDPERLMDLAKEMACALDMRLIDGEVVDRDVPQHGLSAGNAGPHIFP